MFIGRKVSLTAIEQRLVKPVAKARSDSNRKEGLTDRKISPTDGLELDILGFGGELAFCKAFNLYPDLYVKPRKPIDDKGDAVFGGLGLDVKTNSRDNGDLLIASWKPSKYVQGYALMTGKFPVFTYRGMIEAEEATQPWWLKDLGRGESYVIPQSKLKETI